MTPETNLLDHIVSQCPDLDVFTQRRIAGTYHEVATASSGHGLAQAVDMFEAMLKQELIANGWDAEDADNCAFALSYLASIIKQHKEAALA